MRIGVLGISGEIGARLVNYLLQNKIETRLIGRNIGTRLIRYDRDKLDFVNADLFDKNALQSAFTNCDVIVNCAIDKSEYKTAQEGIDQNIIAINNVLMACKTASVKHYIDLSSTAVMPDKMTRTVLDNTFEYSTSDDAYCKTKIATEKEVVKFSGQLHTTIIRAGVVYGPYMHWSKLAHYRATNFNITLPDVAKSYCLAIYVDDLVKLIVSNAMYKPHESGKILYGINPEVVSWDRYYNEHGYASGNLEPVCRKMSVQELRLMNEVKGDVLMKPSPKRKIIDAFRSVYGATPSFIRTSNIGKQLLHTLKAANYGLINYSSYLSPPKTKAKKLLTCSDGEIEAYSCNEYPTPAECGVNEFFKYETDFSKGAALAGQWITYNL
jgi:nucleoside-diphosphate-sugar epimerase